MIALRVFSLAAGVVLVSAHAGPVKAEEAASARSMVVEEVVVTARKREESVQEIPLAVTTFSAEQMRSDGVFDLRDIDSATPNLEIEPVSQGSPTGIAPRLRGQTAADDLLLTVDPAVAIYLDGAVMPHGFGLGANLFDLERIEILKGPQGTLYGKNTTGGAINIISRKADFDGVHGYATVDAGDYGNIDATAAVNLPIVQDVMAVRLAAQRNSRDGFGENTGQCVSLPDNAPGLPASRPQSCSGADDLFDDDEWNFRANVLLQPTDSLTVSITGDYSEYGENGQMTKWFGWVLDENIDTAPEGLRQAASELYGMRHQDLSQAQLDFADDFMRSLVGTVRDDAFDGTGGNRSEGTGRFGGRSGKGDATFDESRIWGISATVTIALDENVTLKSITSYRSFDNDRNTEIGGTPFLIHESPQDAWGDSITQEINLSGSNLDDRLRWIGGAYYGWEDGNDGSTSYARPAHSGAPWGAIRGEIENRAWAFFGQGEYDITEKLTLTAGARYTDESRDMSLFSHATFGAWDPIAKNSTPLGAGICLTGFGVIAVDPMDGSGPEQPGGAGGCYIEYPQVSANDWSWTVNLAYRFDDDVMAYARTSRGWRSGGQPLRDINIAPIADPTLNQLGPEFAQDVEVGVKADFLDNRLRVNAAYFTVDYTDVQVSFLRPGAALSTVLDNAAEQDIQGFELESWFSPAEGLTFRATVGWLDQEWKDFVEVQPNGGGLGVEATVDRAGETVSCDASRCPREWTYSLMGRYEFPIGDMRLGLQANWSWFDEAKQDRFATYVIAGWRGQSELLEYDKRVRESRGLLNIRADLEIPEWEANVAFYMMNVTDETQWHIATGIASRQYITALVGPPRMWGVQVTKRFGE